MDVFNGEPYKFNKRFLLLCGLWPSQDSKAILFKRVVIVAWVTFLTLIQLIAFVNSGASEDYLAAVVPPALLFGIAAIKYSTLWFKARVFENILDSIVLDWENEVAEEVYIIKLYAIKARNYGMYYMVSVYSGMGSMVLTTISPKILDIIIPLNESREIYFPVKLIYFAEKADYPFLVQLHYITCFFLILSLFLGPEMMYITILLHACGKFKVICYCLEHFFDKDVTKINDSKENYVAQKFVSRIIKHHVDALEYVKLINACYGLSYTIQLFLSVGILTINMFCVFHAIYVTNNLKKATGFCITIVATIFCIFISIYPCQELLNHSSIIQEKVYTGKWYSVSIQTQKMLMLLMMKSLKPSTLILAGFLNCSYESFTMILRTSMSYFMVLYSIQ